MAAQMLTPKKYEARFPEQPSVPACPSCGHKLHAAGKCTWGMDGKWCECERDARKYVGECCQCLEFHFLMPVRICAGSVEPVTVRLCLGCRLDLRDDRWCCLATTIEHAPKRKDEAAQ